MQIRARKGSDERHILTGMITSDFVLAQIAANWDRSHGGLFKSRWGNIVAAWCVSHFNRFKEAPGRTIQMHYERWAAANQKDESTLNLVEKFLTSLSDEFELLQSGERLNEAHLIDRANEYFNTVKLRRLLENVEHHLEAGDYREAHDAVLLHHPLAIGEIPGTDVLQDKDQAQEVFEEEADDLFSYPGHLGRFFSGALTRDSFIAFMAPEKTGKSWWMIDMAYRAICERCKVVFFSAGDLSHKQTLRRFYSRIAQWPMEACILPYPVEILAPSDELPYGSIRTEDREFDVPLSWRKALRCMEKATRRKIRSKESYLKVSTSPAGTLSVDNIRGLLASWERKGWKPDVIIIDYADILAPRRGITEVREKTNDIWTSLRALSQEQRCLVVTATQANASSYFAPILTRSNFSEDKRKLAHVNGIIGINQTSDEKDRGMYRLNWLLRREREYSPGWCVHTAGLLGIGNPAIRSAWFERTRAEQHVDGE